MNPPSDTDSGSKDAVVGVFKSSYTIPESPAYVIRNATILTGSGEH